MNLKILTIKKSIEFKKISNISNKKTNKFFAQTLILLSSKTENKYFQDLQNQQNAKDFCRIGYTVSKKVGNAVARNKAKRRLREVFAKLANDYAKTHYDYIIIAKKEIAEADFSKISSDLKFCLKRINNQSKEA